MKKIMVSMAVALLATASIANSTPLFQESAATVAYAQEKTEVKPEELPDAIKSALAAAPYSDWKIEKAFAVQGEDGTTTFSIDLSKGEETQTAKFDQDGKVIE